MLGNFWGSKDRPSTPKRTNTLIGKPAPLPPKLTTTSDYPPQVSHPPQAAHRLSHSHSHRDSHPTPAPIQTQPQPQTQPQSQSQTHADGQWEHVRNGPGSPESIETDDDESSLERLGYSQVDGDRVRGWATVPAGAPPPVMSSASTQAQVQASSSSWQDEREKLRQQLEAMHAAMRKAEGERDKWERKVMDMRTRDRDRDREGTKSRHRPSAEPGVAEAFKEENDTLKTMVQSQLQQLDGAKEEVKQARAEVERLMEELEVTRTAHKEAAEAMQVSVQQHVSRVEYLTGERDRVRKDRDAIRGGFAAEMEQTKAAHGKEMEQIKKALEEVNHDRAEAHAELRKTRKALDGYAVKMDHGLRENETLRRELANAKDAGRTATDIKQRFSAQAKELTAAREESSTLKREFNQVLALLEDRTSELKGAQSFLTTADAFSGVEVTNTLQRLNAEVLQSTAFMAESMVEQFFHESKGPQTSKSEEQLAACKRASVLLGGSIVHFLGTKKHKDDPILIQIAFQAYLTYHLRWIACAWIIGGEESHNQFIDAIYRSVHDKEAQAIAGRWRALTRAHVPSTSLDDTQLAFQIATRMVSGLSDILLTTGCTAAKADVSSALSSKFSEKLSFLISLAIRVNKIVGEDVTSGDFEVLAIPPGTPFDGTTMEDAYDDGGSVKAKGRVLCATDLGLRKKTRVGMTGEKEKQWEVKVMLKPKVALESVVDIMDE